MADSSLNQVVLDAFRQANGNAGRTDLQTLVQDLLPKSGDGFSAALADASRQIDALRSANQTLAEAVASNTQAVHQNSAGQSGGRGVASTIGSVASTVLGSGLGLAPLATAIAHLFTGGDKEAPPALIPFAPPTPLRLDLGDTRGAFTGVRDLSPLVYGQDGLPKPAAQQTQTAAPQISIHVNAMDSRLFLDHSYEIAQAVQQAMLNMHSLNDVVSDL
jgi:hypothetical protein